jgi:aldehyde dehydrogenase (NAD+)
MQMDQRIEAVLAEFDLSGVRPGAGDGQWRACAGDLIESRSPVDGRVLGRVQSAAEHDYDRIVDQAVAAFAAWRSVPAPRRGQIVRRMGERLRRHKSDLGDVISWEMGKIKAEADGEVQEMIDMADFAVGQSRMLYGRTMPSERPGHRLYEQWHPLGPVGVITSFNFPLAVWAWNAMLALVCGDTLVWKPSSKTPLCAMAVMNLLWPVLHEENLPDGILSLVIGSREMVGRRMAADGRLPLVSATGSVAMGRTVGQTVAGRFGRALLELGGNNAVIVTPSANLDEALKAIVFGAAGTAGQRCTTIRRVIAHRSIYRSLADGLIRAYAQLPIGHPLDPRSLVGPLVDSRAVQAMQAALAEVTAEGGRIVYGGEQLSGGRFDTGTYVRPCICEPVPGSAVVARETFAPILYLLPYDRLEEAIAIQNAVPQGLSSAVFTADLTEAETFLSAAGSDCGIANVNIGTSGAEIGGAFGGEKQTGGGREAGSDAWKTYMRRQTCTIRWSGDMTLSQGIRFDLPDR